KAQRERPGLNTKVRCCSQCHSSQLGRGIPLTGRENLRLRFASQQLQRVLVREALLLIVTCAMQAVVVEIDKDLASLYVRERNVTDFVSEIKRDRCRVLGFLAEQDGTS